MTVGMKTQTIGGEWCIVRGYLVQDNQNIIVNWAGPSQRMSECVVVFKATHRALLSSTITRSTTCQQQ